METLHWRQTTRRLIDMLTSLPLYMSSSDTWAGGGEEGEGEKDSASAKERKEANLRRCKARDGGGGTHGDLQEHQSANWRVLRLRDQQAHCAEETIQRGKRRGRALVGCLGPDLHLDLGVGPLVYPPLLASSKEGIEGACWRVLSLLMLLDAVKPAERRQTQRATSWDDAETNKPGVCLLVCGCACARASVCLVG